MRQHERSHNSAAQGIELPETSPWHPFLTALSRQGLDINTTQDAPINDARRTLAIATLKKHEKWPQDCSSLAQAALEPELLPAPELHRILEQTQSHTWPHELATMTLENRAALPDLLIGFHPVRAVAHTRPNNFSHDAKANAPNVRFTLGLPSRLNGRTHATHSMNDLPYLIVCTDGSCKSNAPGDERIATWAAVVPLQNPKNAPLCIYGLVEGSQDNDRAELVAILEALRSIKASHDSPNILLFSDSESSLESIRTWPQKQTTKRLKMANRDIMHEIYTHLDAHHRLGKHVCFSHFPSHVTDPATYEKKIDKVNSVKRAFGETTFQFALTGNDIADKVAQEAATQALRPRTRNYHQHPTPTLDTYYISCNGALVDTSIHPFIKTLQSEEALRKAQSNNRPRNVASRLANDSSVSKTLSFAPDRSEPNHCGTLSTLAALRFHAYPTLKKLHDIATHPKRGPALAQYYKAMYPDPFCPHCPNSSRTRRT
jgi:ribonuclease HI